MFCLIYCGSILQILADKNNLSIFGLNTDKALGKHYVTSGECQYMVTAAEILLLLHGYNPNGVEIPGIFGSGLLTAVKTFQKAQGLTVSGTCDRNTFLKLIR